MPSKMALFRGFSTTACNSCGNRSEKRGNYTPDGGKGETRSGNEPFGMLEELRSFSRGDAKFTQRRYVLLSAAA